MGHADWALQLINMLLLTAVATGARLVGVWDFTFDLLHCPPLRVLPFPFFVDLYHFRCCQLWAVWVPGIVSRLPFGPFGAV